jgi:hypothetical protein
MVHAGKKPLGLKLVAVFIAKEKKVASKRKLS